MPIFLSTVSLALFATLLAQGCERVAEPSAPPRDGAAMTSEQLQVTPVFSSNVSGFSSPAEMVLRDEPALQKAINEARHDVLMVETPINVDFSRQMVILVATGTRNSGGYGIRVDEVNRRDDGVVARYTVTRPGPECMTTQSITSPVEAVSVPRMEGPVTFDRREVVEDC
ncbi:MAG: protease complex subunit PrcB family protein [Gemmatimonadetes bacterium]|nr:protease complex subunit PrcB family protein [Gemmatimonadota bacterium]